MGTIATGMRAVSDGTQLGKYQLLRRLATGGMAELFLARAAAMAGFEKHVVLKRILPQHAESDDFIKMFLTEARLAATLHHPNIVQVYDIGEEGGQYFFTMEWVQGQDLRRIVRAARKAGVAVPLEHVLHIIAGVAAGLHHAHDKADTDGTPIGIVHRDVSPSNVLVTYDGAVKVVDFGIAKAAAFQSNTIAGTLKGKIPYMSPEQCRGEAVDRRSDIFSIGTLLWEMTTGVRLFAGDNEIAIINRVAKGDVPTPTSIRPDYPRELEAIVMRALHSDPNQRYQNALDLQLDLEDFVRENRIPVSSARVGKFMRELFAEEIEAAAAQLSSERADRDVNRQSGPRAVVPAVLPPVPSLAGPSAMTVVDNSDLLEIPSEVLGRSPAPRIESDVSRLTVTRSDALAASDAEDSMVVRSGAPWKAIAAAVVLLALGGSVIAVMTSDKSAPPPAKSTVIRADVQRPAVEETPAPIAPVDAAVHPGAEPPVPLAEPTNPAAAVPEPDDDVELLPDGPSTATDPVSTPKNTDGPAPGTPTATPAVTPATATKPLPKRPAPERKPDAKKPSPSDTPKKPKWDPDNPNPPQ